MAGPFGGSAQQRQTASTSASQTTVNHLQSLAFSPILLDGDSGSSYDRVFNRGWVSSVFVFLAAPENLAFAVALVLMLLIGVVEAVGLGVGAALDVDHDADGLPLLNWLNPGRLPLLMTFVVLLAAFGLAGLAIQQLAASLSGALLPALYAVPAALVAALPLTSVLGCGLARVLPRDETTAVGLDSLVGRRAQIVVGTATVGSPAQARVRDAYGQVHYVMVEPDIDDQRFGEGTPILLVRREPTGFRAILDTSHFALSEVGPPR